MSNKINELAEAYDLDPQRATAFAQAILSEVEDVIHDLYQALPLETCVILLDLKELIDDRFYSE